MRERQNADLGLNNMCMVSVPAHAEFALNPRRQEPSRSDRLAASLTFLLGSNRDFDFGHRCRETMAVIMARR